MTDCEALAASTLLVHIALRPQAACTEADSGAHAPHIVSVRKDDEHKQHLRQSFCMCGVTPASRLAFGSGSMTYLHIPPLGV